MNSKRLFSSYFDTIDGIFEASDKVVILFDARKFRIQHVNNKFEEFYNIRKDFVNDRKVFDFIPYSKDELIDIIVNIVNGQKYESQVVNIKGKKVTTSIIKLASPGSSDDIFAMLFKPADEMTIEYLHYKDIAEKQNFLISSLTRTYRKMYFIDLKNSNYDIYRITSGKISIEELKEDRKINSSLFAKLSSFVRDEDKEKVQVFLDLSTLKERLKGRYKINIEFESKFDGWIRIGFISCERNVFDEVQTAIFTYRQINDDKKKEISMQNAVKEAIDTSTAVKSIRSEFLTKIDNNIISPLTSILALASQAKSSINESNDDVKQALSKIMDASQKLTKTFTEIVDMSKIESGDVRFKREEIDLGELFTNLVISQKKNIFERRHKITIKNSNVMHDLIYGDKLKLQQIFNNIFDNAIRYTQDEGEIEISIVEKKIQENKIGEYTITFQDNGIGMKEDFIMKALEPFEREERPQVQVLDGEGLGLAIANSYVQKMGGKIKIKSELASGTKVIVTIYAEICNKIYPQYNDFSDTRILFISNNSSQVSDVMATLSSMNIKAHAASNERSAIMQLKEAEKKGIMFSFIICDWQTPTMNGVNVIKKIREAIPFELPKVIFAHYEIESIASEANEVGVNDFVTLPLFRNRIYELMNKLSGKKANEKNNDIRQDKNLKGKKVLIVEDNGLNREILKEFLQMYGIDIYEARDGKEALDMFLKSDDYFYDLVLMDIQMPIMNGYESTMSIRSSEREDGKRIPIIAMSASAFADDINASLIAGMNEHVAKPLNFSSLHNSIEKWFNGDYAARKNLELKARSDSFTDVLNKVATFESIHKYVTKPDVPLSAMLVLDLDHFKNVNDEYGHKEGDQVIYQTTKVICRYFRDNDIIGRFGGDEFIIFMKDIGTKEIAIKRANDVINAIEKEFKGKYSNFELTACVGLAFVDKTMDEDTLFVNADHALYKAKNNGRNQVSYIDAE